VDDVRRHLQEAAEAHQPDRDAIVGRVRQGMARSTDSGRARTYRRRRQASWLKISLAALAAVGVLSLGGLAVAAGIQQLAPQHTTAVVVTPTGKASATPSKPSSPATEPTAQIPRGTSTPRHSAASAAPTASAAAGPIMAQGYVDTHSTVYWEQNVLTVDVAQPLTTLTVELRVAQSGGVQSTGTWQTAPSDDFTVTVTQTDGFVVYRWALKPGRTVPAAQQIFAAQFNHGTGERDARTDTFLVQTTAAGRPVSVRGGFAPGGPAVPSPPVPTGSSSG
jgi:hypothetical protein